MWWFAGSISVHIPTWASLVFPLPFLNICSRLFSNNSPFVMLLISASLKFIFLMWHTDPKLNTFTILIFYVSFPSSKEMIGQVWQSRRWSHESSRTQGQDCVMRPPFSWKWARKYWWASLTFHAHFLSRQHGESLVANFRLSSICRCPISLPSMLIAAITTIHLDPTKPEFSLLIPLHLQCLRKQDLYVSHLLGIFLTISEEYKGILLYSDHPDHKTFAAIGI